MPSNTNILLIRHAEKPDSGTGLTVAGQARAQAYVAYFQKYQIDTRLIKLDYLLAAADSTESHRSHLTLQPLAAALGLEINDQYANKDYQQLADEILQHTRYNGRNLLICWHHGEILHLAAALGATDHILPPASNWPTSSWPDEVFGWLLQVSYDHTGNLLASQTVCLNQRLMYNDHGANPPFAKQK